MALQSYDSLSDVPEDLREYAQEGEDGKYSVKVAPADKIKEFRENNVALSQERDDLVNKVTKYEQVTGVPLDQAGEGGLEDFYKQLEALRDTKQRVDAGNLVENTSLEEAAQARVTEVTNSFKEQLAEAARERDAHKDRAKNAENRANNMQIENSIRLAASDPEVGMLDRAVNLLLPEAQKTFRVEDNGKLTPKTDDGTIIYGSDGVTPMSAKEWLLKQRGENDFLFKSSQGGGASGGDNKKSGELSAQELQKMSPAQRINYYRQQEAKKG